MRVEVIVAAMGQKDFDLVRTMNIQSDALIANQAESFDYAEYDLAGNGTVRMVTTPYRGLGRNRSTGLLYATGDLCALSDEDVTWADDYPKAIVRAFEEVPTADVLVFNLEYEGLPGRVAQHHERVKRLHIWNALRYGAPRIVFRLGAVQRANAWFPLLLGAGSRFTLGEESLFLAECLRKGLRVYTHPTSLGRTNTESSTWFEGYTRDYFIGKGAFYDSLSPRGARLLCARDAVLHRRRYASMASAREAYSLMLLGIEEFRSVR